MATFFQKNILKLISKYVFHLGDFQVHHISLKEQTNKQTSDLLFYNGNYCSLLVFCTCLPFLYVVPKVFELMEAEFPSAVTLKHG